MQREIDDLRRQLQIATESNVSGAGRLEQETVGRHPTSEPTTSTKSRHLGNIELSGTIIDRLFKE